MSKFIFSINEGSVVSISSRRTNFLGNVDLNTKYMSKITTMKLYILGYGGGGGGGLQ